MTNLDGLQFIKQYGLLLFTWITLFPYLGLPEFSYWNAVLQTILLLGWSYFGHIFAHKMSDTGILQKLNPHIFIHHTNIYNVPRWLNLLQELLLNLASFWILIPLSGGLLSTSIILATSIAYVLIHIFDYSIFGNPEHQDHHKHSQCNYAPDFMDVLFDTRCNTAQSYSNGNKEIPHILVAFIIAFVLKKEYGFS